MKLKLLFAALAGIFFATGALAQSSDLVEFRGKGVLTIQSDCTEFGWGVQGDFYFVNTRYRPANVRGNDDRDRLSIFFEFYAMALAVEGKLVKRFKETVSVNVGSNGFQTDPRADAKLIKRTPNNVNQNSPTVRLEVEFRDFDGLRGCRATLDAALVRDPRR